MTCISSNSFTYKKDAVEGESELVEENSSLLFT